MMRMTMGTDLFGGEGGGGSPIPTSTPIPSKRPKGVVFFAVRPDVEANAAATTVLDSLQAQHGLTEAGLAPDSRHVTLFPIGHAEDLTPAAIDVVRRVAAAQEMKSFDATFDRAMSFNTKQPKQPLVLVGSDGNEKTMLFRRAFLADMKRVGLHFKGMSGFTPHMTLLYSARTITEQPVKPIRWTVREFVLIHSHYGYGRHEILGRWQLED